MRPGSMCTLDAFFHRMTTQAVKRVSNRSLKGEPANVSLGAGKLLLDFPPRRTS